MKKQLKAIYRNLPSPIQRPLKYLYSVCFPPASERLMYRVALFDEMLNITGKDYFRDRRILEIGPKDGLDSKRLASLMPVELVMVDLPEKREGNEQWLNQITCQKKYIETNFMYMSTQEYETLGSFRLIWCTGVLYHNAEQMRILRKLYRLLEVGGYLVLESATLRLAKSLRSGSYVEIHYPKTYRQTGTITHLPTVGAIRAWLAMVGFQEIHDSDCYRNYNRNLIRQRYACICKKKAEDESDVYYQKSGLNPKYRFGDST